MIKLQELIGLPSLQYHIDNGLTLHSNVYRYNSDAFINLFKEAREAHRDGKIQLNEEDTKLLETTDIGEYGDYNGIRVPLDLPMVSPKYNPLFEIGCMIDEMIEDIKQIDQNEERYQSYINEPLFVDNTIPESVKPDAILKFFKDTVLSTV